MQHYFLESALDEDVVASSEVIDNVVSITEHLATNIIMVTHDPIIDDLLNHFLYKYCGSHRQMHMGLRYGEAALLNVDTGEVQVIRQTNLRG